MEVRPDVDRVKISGRSRHQTRVEHRRIAGGRGRSSFPDNHPLMYLKKRSSFLFSSMPILLSLGRQEMDGAQRKPAPRVIIQLLVISNP
jgi:hypothetical protein